MRRGQPPVAGKPAAGYMTRTPPQPTAARRQRHLPTKYRPRRSTGRCAVAKASKQVDKPLGGRPSGQVAAVLAAGEYTVAAAARRRGTQPPTRLTAYRHRSAPPPLTTTAAANHRRRHQRDRSQISTELRHQFASKSGFLGEWMDPHGNDGAVSTECAINTSSAVRPPARVKQIQHLPGAQPAYPTPFSPHLHETSRQAR